jgi:hypothetical protein
MDKMLPYTELQANLSSHHALPLVHVEVFRCSAKDTLYCRNAAFLGACRDLEF